MVPHKHTTKCLNFVAVLIVTVLLSGVSIAQNAASTYVPSTWAAVVEAAKKEGKVVVYSNQQPAVNDRIREDFGKAYPDISIEVIRVIGNALNSKIEVERKAGTDGADAIISADVGYTDQMGKTGLLKVPSGPAAVGWPAHFMLGGIVPILNLEPAAILYNTNLVKTPITGYQDLLRPEFKSKIGTSEPVAEVLVAWYEWLEATQGADFLAKFAANSPRLYIGTTALAQSTASGELSVSAIMLASTALPLIEQGAPIKLVYPKTSLAILYVGGALVQAKRPNAALVFMDYLMSVRGQTTWNGHGGQSSALPGIPNTIDSSSLVFYDPAKYPSSVVAAYTQKWNKMFKAGQ